MLGWSAVGAIVLAVMIGMYWGIENPDAEAPKSRAEKISMMVFFALILYAIVVAAHLILKGLGL
jgi:hypothetical protein